MGRPRRFSMEEAVGAATKLFWRGYERTSLAELTTTLKVGPASFYFAFGSKEALFRQVIERYLARLHDAFQTAFQSDGIREAVELLLRGYVDVITDPDHARGCLLVNSAPSVDAEDELRRWLATHREALRIRLEERFSAGVARGELPAKTDPKAMARFVATLAGGLAVEAGSGATRRELYDAIAIAMRAFPA